MMKKINRNMLIVIKDWLIIINTLFKYLCCKIVTKTSSQLLVKISKGEHLYFLIIQMKLPF